MLMKGSSYPQHILNLPICFPMKVYVLIPLFSSASCQLSDIICHYQWVMVTLLCHCYDHSNAEVNSILTTVTVTIRISKNLSDKEYWKCLTHIYYLKKKKILAVRLNGSQSLLSRLMSKDFMVLFGIVFKNIFFCKNRKII